MNKCVISGSDGDVWIFKHVCIEHLMFFQTFRKRDAFNLNLVPPSVQYIIHSMYQALYKYVYLFVHLQTTCLSLYIR